MAMKFPRAPKRQTVERTLAALIDIDEKEVSPTKGKVLALTTSGLWTCPSANFDETQSQVLCRAENGTATSTAAYRKAAPKGVKPGQSVRPRVVQQDLRLLLATLNWATRASDGHGPVLLDRNPLRGLRPPKDESPKRAILSDAQYEALLEAAVKQSPQAALWLRR